jgi:chemotaxis protein MotB
MRLSQFLSSDELYKDKDGNVRRYRIEGHTDSSSFSSEKYASNWELSAARAANVLHYLADYGCDESRFVIAGYADTRPKFSNDTEEGRAYNRRVDIIILDEGHF